jgi:hypothetical protein
MRLLNGLTMLATVTAFCIGGSKTAKAVGGMQTVPDLEIAITTAQSEAVEGGLVWWQVSLTNMSETTLTQVEIQPTGQAWLWPDGPQTIGSLPKQDSIVVEIPAVPLKTGEVWPTLKVLYIVGQAHRSTSATADHPVNIISPSALVEAEVVPRRATARVDQPLSMDVCITNRSPFTLTNVSLRGMGADMEWRKATAAPDMPPNATSSIPMTPTIQGKSPQAILALEYHWSDATGKGLSEKTIVRGDSLDVEEAFLSRVSPSAALAIIGALLGLGAWSVQSLYERRQRRLVNRERVWGMLHMIAVEAKHGAEEGVRVSLDSLQQLFNEENLYAALKQLNRSLKHRDLVLCVQELWEAAHRHNTGIEHPGGATRTTDLQSKADVLADHLREMKRESILRKLFRLVRLM